MKNSQRPYSGRRHKAGSVLIIVLGALVLFSILCTGLYGIVSAQIKMAKTAEARILSSHLAKAAYFNARLELGREGAASNTLYDLRKERKVDFGTNGFRYYFLDEETKININNASTEIISRLPGMDQDTADAIFNSELKPFSLIEEVTLVDSVSEEKYEKFKDLITVYTDRGVNINTAPAAVLAILGMDSSLIDRIIGFRAGPDEKEATADDGVFKSTNEIIDNMRYAGSLSGAQEALLLQLIGQGRLVTSSKKFSLKVDALILDKPVMSYIIIMDKDSMKRWIEQ